MWFLLLSLGFHSALLVLWPSAPTTVHDFTNAPPIEIAELPPEERLPRPKQRKQKEPEIAETEDAKKKELDPNTHILSDRNQTADKQTKAAQTDDFRKKQGTGLQSNSQKRTIPRTGDPTAKGAQLGPGEQQEPADQKNAGVKRNWKALTLQDLGFGGKDGPMAATDDRLSDIQTGDKTVLSTREFKFFSYYHRIKETLRQYWKPNVERKLAMLWSKGARMKDAELVTQVLVMLDRNGKITKINRVTSSGFEDLDQAAMDAFQEAAPFPNPPAAMVDPDGLVRIRWDFILKTEASPQITFRGGGPQRRMP